MEKKTTPPSPSLPYDLLREVLERCDDHETLVRCAASSKLLCRCILDRDPSAIRRLAAAGFAPSLFLGIFHQSSCGGATRFVESPAPAVVPRHPIRSFVSRNADDLLTWFEEPAACGGGLLILRGYSKDQTANLCVCNPMTGDCGLLPRPEVLASLLAILVGDEDDGRPFQLLAVDQVDEPWGWGEDQRTILYVRSQLFSSPAGGSSSPAIMPSGTWGPVRRAQDQGYIFTHQDFPVVINRVAHWLMHGANVLALDADEGGTELITRPRELNPRFIRPNDALLASTPDRRLSILVVEELVISMFVLSSSEHSRSWERRALVVREGILAPPRRMRLEFFGERSGIVAITMACQPGWLLLNLETKEVTMYMCSDMEQQVEEEQGLLPRWWVSQLYETDLPSLATALLEYPHSGAGASSKLTIKFGQLLTTVDIARALKPRKTFIGANLLKKAEHASDGKR